MANTIAVSVDPSNNNRLIMGSLVATMTDHTHFTISTQISTLTYNGSGTIDGTNMTINYSTSIPGLSTVSCGGSFTKK
jgi:hypothetical protein